MQSFVFRDFLPGVPRPQLIDPNRLRDPKHPAVEPSPFLELMRPGQRPFACGLDEIIGFGSGAGQTASKAPKAR
jgi:hypothetical protein